MNFDDFSYTENDRRYINPQVSLDEQNAFIDNLRNMQRTNTAQITQDTRNLGTQVPSNLGGLGGGTSYFTSRYQTPQTNSMVSDLRATAQANALSTLLSNELSKAQKRYQDAYRSAQKRAKSSSGGGGGNTYQDLLDALGLSTSNRDNAGPLAGTEPGESGEEELSSGTVSGRKWDLKDTGAAIGMSGLLNLVPGIGPLLSIGSATWDAYNAANNNPSGLEQIYQWFNR